jgi:hypothetical protein
MIAAFRSLWFMHIINSIFALIMTLLFGLFAFQLSIVPLRSPWQPVGTALTLPTPAARNLTDEQQAEMLLILSRYSGSRIEIVYHPADEGNEGFSEQLQTVFAKAGWQVKLSGSSTGAAAAPLLLEISAKDLRQSGLPSAGSATQLPEMQRALKALLTQFGEPQILVSEKLPRGGVQLHIGRASP